MDLNLKESTREHPYMEKRTHKRIPVSLEFHCNKEEYFGAIMNLSENGMYIRSQKINFPLESQFEIAIPIEDNMFNIPIKIIRLTKSNGYYDGMGVELLKIPKKYLKLINKLRMLSSKR
jgi:hypothetical protein